MSLLRLGFLVGSTLFSSLVVSTMAGCASAPEDDASGASSEDELRRRTDAEWFYDGPLPALEEANVTLSIKGHTARVSGYVPYGVNVPNLGSLPHVKAQYDGGRILLDVVYPIATARPGKSNSSDGVYRFQSVKPYRPDGLAYTIQEGEHFVPWGGYPFIAYNGGIAFHGPISYTDPLYTPEPGDDVWYLMRGPVSGGCNRMAAEHVVELTHIVGVSMRKVYTANKSYAPNTSTTVTVIADYDVIDDKYVDVDYPTYGAAVRPGSLYGTENVEMFGSWAATETPDGRDLPPSMKWEGGVRGKYYVFREHTKSNFVCAVEKTDLPALKTFAARFANGELPKNFCKKRDCVVNALRSGQDARTRCSL